MKSFFKSLFSGLIKQVLYQSVLKHVKRKVVLAYLKTLQAMRKSLILAFAVFIIMQLMIFGFLGLVITSIWLVPSFDQNMKLYVLLGFFGFIFFIPTAIFCVILSQGFWYKISGADQMLNENL